ncbi:hypothetical protein NL676_021181 [Syzygium grande]|nr:hypothetical protein NL676_021181 [Syzygium grande]
MNAFQVHDRDAEARLGGIGVVGPSRPAIIDEDTRELGGSGVDEALHAGPRGVEGFQFALAVLSGLWSDGGLAGVGRCHC